MLIKEIFKEQSTKIFSILDDEDENQLNWLIEPTKLEIIPEDEGHYLVIAKEVLHADKTIDCFINVITPERIAEIVVINKNGKAKIEDLYDQETSVIPAVASDCFGVYELYYAKENPQAGIDILKSGLIKSKVKTAIAEDLGYILRDENRIKEAIEYFLISEQTTPSSEYIYDELAQLYRDLGEKEKQLEYEKKFESNS